MVNSLVKNGCKDNYMSMLFLDGLSNQNDVLIDFHGHIWETY